MRRACSSDVRSVSFLGSVAPEPVKCTRGSRMSPAARYSASRRISAATGGGTRPSIGNPSPPRSGSRTRRRRGGDREQLDPLGLRQPRNDPLDHRQVHPGAGSRAEPRELEHALRANPRGERGELVGADQEDGSSRASASSESAVRANGSSETSARRSREGELREVEPRGAGVWTPLCPGSATTRTSRRSRPKYSMPHGRVRHARCAAGRRRRPGCRPPLHSQIQLPRRRSHLGPRFTPARAECLLELRALRRGTDDPKSLAGAKYAEAAAARAAGPVIEEVGKLRRDGRLGRSRGQNRNSARRARRSPPRSHRRRGGPRGCARRGPRTAPARGAGRTC